MPDERRDDWKHGVDENLASLNTGQRVSDRLIEDLEVKYEVIDKILRGDPETDTDGFAARLHAVETGIREIQAEKVKSKIEDVEIRKSKWEFSGRILERILMLAVALLLGWDKLVPLYKKLIHDNSEQPIHTKVKRAR